jgi:hypothetical protein
MDLKGESRGIFENINPAFASKDMSGIRTGCHPNTIYFYTNLLYCVLCFAFGSSLYRFSYSDVV